METFFITSVLICTNKINEFGINFPKPLLEKIEKGFFVSKMIQLRVKRKTN